MAAEFGLFNDEGIVEGQFHSREEAQAAIEERYSVEDALEVFEVCPEHPDHTRICCEECDTEEEEEAAMEAEEDDMMEEEEGE